VTFYGWVGVAVAAGALAFVILAIAGDRLDPDESKLAFALGLVMMVGFWGGLGTGFIYSLVENSEGGGGPPPPPSKACHPSYKGECLKSDASDYDCAGGSGDGPEYAGPVEVVGSDDYGLDRDGDGYACE
jgi:hypothetical protein